MDHSLTAILKEAQERGMPFIGDLVNDKNDTMVVTSKTVEVAALMFDDQLFRSVVVLAADYSNAPCGYEDVVVGVNLTVRPDNLPEIQQIAALGAIPGLNKEEEYTIHIVSTVMSSIEARAVQFKEGGELIVAPRETFVSDSCQTDDIDVIIENVAVRELMQSARLDVKKCIYDLEEELKVFVSKTDMDFASTLIPRINSAMTWMCEPKPLLKYTEFCPFFELTEALINCLTDVRLDVSNLREKYKNKAEFLLPYIKNDGFQYITKSEMMNGLSHVNGNALIVSRSDRFKCEDFDENVQLALKAGRRENYQLFIVDVDIGEGDESSEKSMISHYNGGICICTDVRSSLSNINLVTSTNHEKGRGEDEMPERALFKASCPRCKETPVLWTCKKCSTLIEYCCNGIFVCDCGWHTIDKMKFKCGNYFHLSFSPCDNMKDIQEELRAIVPAKQTNILIVGPSGVGKTTWINGFVNYLKYPEFDDAVSGEILALIPMQFTICDKFGVEHKMKLGGIDGDDYGDNEEPRDVRINVTGGEKNKKGEASRDYESDDADDDEDENDDDDEDEYNVDLEEEDDDEIEDLTEGASATQLSRSYVFYRGCERITLVDTPGLGDTRGYEQDASNIRGIMQHLKSVPQIHAVCFVLLPNESRLNVLMSFVLQEIFSNLHTVSKDNIFFLLTNARSTNYRPGSSISLIDKIAKKFRNVGNYCLSDSRVYMFDNEAFRFLCALKRTPVSFTDHEKLVFKSSWVTTCKELNRFLNCVSKLEPYDASKSQQIHKTRMSLLLLASKKIDHKSGQSVENLQDAIERNKETIATLKETYFEIRKTVKTSSAIPHIVCAAVKCVEVHNGQKFYKNTCLTPFTVTPEFLKCRAAAPIQSAQIMQHGVCTKCQCIWDQHMVVTYDQSIIDETVVNQTVAAQIDKLNLEIEMWETDIAMQNANSGSSYNDELVCKKKGKFLAQTAILLYNDATDQYLSYLIDSESVKADKKQEDFDKIDRLKDIKKKNKEVEGVVKQFETVLFVGCDRHLKESAHHELADLVGREKRIVLHL